MGIAQGCIGLSYGDFFRLTVEEFEAIYEAWRKRKESESRERWELMRMESAILIQPHVKERITPRRLLPFSWDDEKTNREREELTPEERKARAEEARKKWG